MSVSVLLSFFLLLLILHYSNDDVPGSSGCAPDDGFHREADADVALDGERDRQPDARVTADVRQLTTDTGLVSDVHARRAYVYVNTQRSARLRL